MQRVAARARGCKSTYLTTVLSPHAATGQSEHSNSSDYITAKGGCATAKVLQRGIQGTAWSCPLRPRELYRREIITLLSTSHGFDCDCNNRSSWQFSGSCLGGLAAVLIKSTTTISTFVRFVTVFGCRQGAVSEWCLSTWRHVVEQHRRLITQLPSPSRPSLPGFQSLRLPAMTWFSLNPKRMKMQKLVPPICHHVQYGLETGYSQPRSGR